MKIEDIVCGKKYKYIETMATIRVELECDYCNGQGMLKLEDLREIPCPMCRGRKKTYTWEVGDAERAIFPDYIIYNNVDKRYYALELDIDYCDDEISRTIIPIEDLYV